MSKKHKQAGKRSMHPPVTVKPLQSHGTSSLWQWLSGIAAVTAVCLFPMLKNEFTNWDDEFYVINNNLLPGPDLAGIFSEPVVGNYHPLTVLSLAFNYAISQLDPFSYLLVNYLLHTLILYLYSALFILSVVKIFLLLPLRHWSSGCIHYMWNL
jgi:hypothetical protein